MKNENNYNDLYEDFVQRLLSGDYNLYEADKKTTELLFNSNNTFPELDKIPSYLFKINFLSDMLSREMAHNYIQVGPYDIIDNIRHEKVIVYHKKKMDPRFNQDVDYFFVIDCEIFIALGYRIFTGPSNRRFFQHDDEKTFIPISSLDIDYIIEDMLVLLGLDVSSEPLVDKESLFSLFAEKDLYLIISTNTGEAVSYEKDTIALYILPENPSHAEIRINVKEKPIVDSLVSLVIKDEKKVYYKLSGALFSERTLKIGLHYRLDILIEIKSIKDMNNLKAMLFFMQSLNVD